MLARLLIAITILSQRLTRHFRFSRVSVFSCVAAIAFPFFPLLLLSTRLPSDASVSRSNTRTFVTFN